MSVREDLGKAVFASVIAASGVVFSDSVIDEPDVHQYLDLNIASKHSRNGYIDDTGTQRSYNEVNRGVGYTHLRTVQELGVNTELRLGGTVGYYLNSREKDTFYGMGVVEAAKRLSDKWTVAVGGQLGVATGYDYISDKTLTPAGQFYMRAERKLQEAVGPFHAVSGKLGYLPRVDLGDNDFGEPKTIPEVFTLQLGVTF